MEIYKSWIEEGEYSVIMDRSNTYYASYLKIEQGLALSKTCKNATCLIYGGGGYFGEPVNASFKWYVKMFIDHLLPALYFKAVGKPYLILGIGFGPLSNSIIRKLTLSVFNGASLVSVRDNPSKENLVKYGFKKEVHVVPDSALSIGLKAGDPLTKKNGRKKIVLHLPFDSGQEEEKQRKIILGFIKHLSENVDADFIYMVDHGVGKNSFQYKLFESYNQELGLGFPIKEFLDPKDTLDFIKQHDVTITTKLHVAITSYALGVLPFSISKHQKTTRFFQQVGLSDYHYDLRGLKASMFPDIVMRLKDQPVLENVPSRDILEASLKNRELILDFLSKVN